MSSVDNYLAQVTKEMGLFADPPQMTEGRKDRILAEEDVDGETHSNSHDYDPILSKTQRLLDDFYKPYNDELFRLIGRDLTHLW